MKWKLRPPHHFPASFHEAILTSFQEDREVILFSSKSREEILRRAELFRYFRFCLRNSGFGTKLAQIERDCVIRSRIEREVNLWTLKIRVREPIESRLARLNLHLSDLDY